MSDLAVVLEGEWTIPGAAVLREALLTHVAQRAHVYDLQGITEMDSSGLQLLLALQRSLARQGQELTLQAISPAVKQVLQNYGLDTDLRNADELAKPSEVDA
jgi:anti-anti-sigma factor